MLPPWFDEVSKPQSGYSRPPAVPDQVTIFGRTIHASSGSDARDAKRRQKFCLSRDALPQDFKSEFYLESDLKSVLLQLMWELEYEIIPQMIEIIPMEPTAGIALGERLQTAVRLLFHFLSGRARELEGRGLLLQTSLDTVNSGWKFMIDMISNLLYTERCIRSMSNGGNVANKTGNQGASTDASRDSNAIAQTGGTQTTGIIDLLKQHASEHPSEMTGVLEALSTMFPSGQSSQPSSQPSDAEIDGVLGHLQDRLNLVSKKFAPSLQFKNVIGHVKRYPGYRDLPFRPAFPGATPSPINRKGMINGGMVKGTMVNSTAVNATAVGRTCMMNQVNATGFMNQGVGATGVRNKVNATGIMAVNRTMVTGTGVNSTMMPQMTPFGRGMNATVMRKGANATDVNGTVMNRGVNATVLSRGSRPSPSSQKGAQSLAQTPRTDPGRTCETAGALSVVSLCERAVRTFLRGFFHSMVSLSQTTGPQNTKQIENDAELMGRAASDFYHLVQNCLVGVSSSSDEHSEDPKSFSLKNRTLHSVEDDEAYSACYSILENEIHHQGLLFEKLRDYTVVLKSKIESMMTSTLEESGLASSLNLELFKFSDKRPDMNSQKTPRSPSNMRSGSASVSPIGSRSVKASNADDDLAPPSITDGERLKGEAEFLQGLLDVNVLQATVNNNLNKPEFYSFLRYLEYWHRPKYRFLLDFPSCLDVLEVLNRRGQELIKKPFTNELRDIFKMQLYYVWSRRGETKCLENEVTSVLGHCSQQDISRNAKNTIVQSTLEHQDSAQAMSSMNSSGGIPGIVSGTSTATGSRSPRTRSPHRDRNDENTIQEQKQKLQNFVATFQRIRKEATSLQANSSLQNGAGHPAKNPISAVVGPSRRITEVNLKSLPENVVMDRHLKKLRVLSSDETWNLKYGKPTTESLRTSRSSSFVRSRSNSLSIHRSSSSLRHSSSALDTSGGRHTAGTLQKISSSRKRQRQSPAKGIVKVPKEMTFQDAILRIVESVGESENFLNDRFVFKSQPLDVTSKDSFNVVNAAGNVASASGANAGSVNGAANSMKPKSLAQDVRYTLRQVVSKEPVVLPNDTVTSQVGGFVVPNYDEDFAAKLRQEVEELLERPTKFRKHWKKDLESKELLLEKIPAAAAKKCNPETGTPIAPLLPTRSIPEVGTHTITGQVMAGSIGVIPPGGMSFLPENGLLPQKSIEQLEKEQLEKLQKKQLEKENLQKEIHKKIDEKRKTVVENYQKFFANELAKVTMRHTQTEDGSMWCVRGGVASRMKKGTSKEEIIGAVYVMEDTKLEINPVMKPYYDSSPSLFKAVSAVTPDFLTRVGQQQTQSRKEIIDYSAAQTVVLKGTVSANGTVLPSSGDTTASGKLPSSECRIR